MQYKILRKVKNFLIKLFIKEIWKDIKGFDGLYQISNLGKVKSLVKKYHPKEKLLKPAINSSGYYCVLISNHKITRGKSVHSLVWDHFGNKPRNGRKLQIDHIDNNPLNNRIDNLQLLTNRQNVSKGWKNKKTRSKHTGIYWHNQNKKWYSMIQINGKNKYLGSFNTELEALSAYKLRFNSLVCV